MRRAWVKQDMRAAPVGRRLEPGQLDRAGEAQPQLHRGRDEFAVGVGGRDARHRLGVADHQVIAALGFERHLVAERGGERLRPGAGADDRGVGRQLAGIGADRGQPRCRRGGTRARLPARSRRPRAGTARRGGSRGGAGCWYGRFRAPGGRAHTRATGPAPAGAIRRRRTRRFRPRSRAATPRPARPSPAPRRSGRRRDGRADGSAPRRRRRAPARAPAARSARSAAAARAPAPAPSPASPSAPCARDRAGSSADRSSAATAARAGPRASPARCG